MRISDWSSDVCSSDLLHRIDERPVNVDRSDEANGPNNRSGDALSNEAMAIRSPMMRTVVAGALLWIAGCSEPESGPIAVSAIGDPPTLVNPNLKRLDPASAFLSDAAAQGLAIGRAAVCTPLTNAHLVCRL